MATSSLVSERLKCETPAQRFLGAGVSEYGAGFEPAIPLRVYAPPEGGALSHSANRPFPTA